MLLLMYLFINVRLIEPARLEILWDCSRSLQTFIYDQKYVQSEKLNLFVHYVLSS